MNAHELWAVCTDLDGHVDTLGALLDTMAFILDSIETTACPEGNENTAKALCFAKQYPAFSKMLFALLNGMQDQAKSMTALVDKAFDIQSAMRTTD